MAKTSTKVITAPIVGYPATATNTLHKDGRARHIHNHSGSSLARSLRSMTISSPTTKENTSFSTTLRSNIILVAKYAFHAESPNELTVRQGDVLKLLDRPGNGWLLVKFIDKLVPPGLVPACYVDIAINDPKNPVTLNWLQSSQQSSLNLMNEKSYLQIQLKQSSAPPLTINNKAYPVSISISNFLLYKKRYWYRLDVSNSDSTKSYVCRYYQDFYNLHVKLVQWLNMSSAPLNDTLKLPKLPEPIPGGTGAVSSLFQEKSSHDSDDQEEVSPRTSEVNFSGDEEQIKLLLKRCNDLNVYINRLILNKNYQLSEIIIDWLDNDYKELPGFTVEKSDLLDNDDINERMLPGSYDIVKEYYERKKKKDVIEEVAEEDEDAPSSYSPSSPPQRTKSRKNIFNHYQQGGNLNNASVVQRSKSRQERERQAWQNGQIGQNVPSPQIPSVPSIPNGQQLPNTGSNQQQNYTYNLPQRAISSASNSSSSTDSHSPNNSPLMTRVSPVPMAHLKCKIMNYNNEIVAIRLNKQVIRSVFDFKRLLKQKIFFTKLFIKMPDGQEFENVDEVHNLIERLRSLEKVFLRIA